MELQCMTVQFPKEIAEVIQSKATEEGKTVSQFLWSCVQVACPEICPSVVSAESIDMSLHPIAKNLGCSLLLITAEDVPTNGSIQFLTVSDGWLKREESFISFYEEMIQKATGVQGIPKLYVLDQMNPDYATLRQLTKKVKLVYSKDPEDYQLAANDQYDRIFDKYLSTK